MNEDKEKLVPFISSVPESMLKAFDLAWKEKGYSSRVECIRHLIRIFMRSSGFEKAARRVKSEEATVKSKCPTAH